MSGRVVLLTEAATFLSDRDFSSVDAYLEETELHFWEGEGAQKRTDTIDLAPPQTDVRNNPNEMPSALGRFFAQGDFSHGEGQPYFHYDSSDQAKFLHSEGFDTSELGLLKHLPAVLTASGGALGASSSGRQATCQGKKFICDGTQIRVYDTLTGAESFENPHAGEGAVSVQDVTAEGDRLFVALGANGIHVRSALGVYTHYSDAQAIRVAWVKERLAAASARDFYEITTSGAAPASKQPLKEGWTYTDIGENGAYIYAPSVNEAGGQSKIFHFGLDNSLAVAVQGSTWMPNDELCYSFKGYLNMVVLGCGRVNSSGGKDGLLYKALPSENGYLPIDLVAESEGAGSRDLAIRAIATQGRNFLLGWTLGASSPYGVREGLAKYDPALDSFSTHLASSTDTATPESVLSASLFEGRVMFVTADGVYYEDITKKVAQATLISSIATWNNPALKNWDESNLSTKELPATSSVDLQYSLVHPKENIWSLAGQHTITDETEATFRHANVKSPRFAVKLVSHATSSQADAPEIESFSVRSNPTVEDTEFRLLRTVHLIGTIAKSSSSTVKNYNPRDERDNLRSLMRDWFDWHEADCSYNVRLAQMSEIKAVTKYQSTQGDPLNEEYVVVVELEGRVA